MTLLIYNNNNTEGHFPTSYDFRDTELRKDAKIVATDLVDLYDVVLTNLQNGEILVYDNPTQKWINGQAGTSGCTVVSSDIEYTVGTSGNFVSIKECFDWLRNNCKVIDENTTITVKLTENMYISEKTSLNHPYSHRIVLDGQGFDIITHDAEKEDANLSLSDSSSIKFKNTRLRTSYFGQGISKKHAFLMNEDVNYTPHKRDGFLTNHNGILYSFGGMEYDGIGNQVSNNKRVYKCISILYSKWEVIETNIPSSLRVSRYSVKVDDKIYTFNGASNGFNTIWVYDFNTNTWTETPPCTGDIPPLDITTGYTLTLYNNKIYLVGGYLGTTTNINIYAYDISLNTWTEYLSLSLIGIAFHSTSLYNDKLYIYGGSGGFQQYLNGLTVVDLINHTSQITIPYTQIYQGSTTPYKSGLAYHYSHINDDGIMFLYFGARPVISNTFFRSGSREIYAYDIGEDSWELLETVQGMIPFGRYEFTVMDSVSYTLGGFFGFNASGDYDYDYPNNYFFKIHNENKEFEIDEKPSSEFNIIETDIYASCLNIKNNSNIEIENVASIPYYSSYHDPKSLSRATEIIYHVSYIIETLDINLIGVINNSSLTDNGSVGHINSMFTSKSTIDMTPLNQVSYKIKNGSVITNDITKFSESTFINSKLIEKK